MRRQLAVLLCLAALWRPTPATADILPPGHHGIAHELVFEPSPLFDNHQLVAAPIRGFQGVHAVTPGQPFDFSKYGTRLYLFPKSEPLPQEFDRQHFADLPGAELPIGHVSSVPIISPTTSAITTLRWVEVRDRLPVVVVVDHKELDSAGRPTSFLRTYGWLALPGIGLVILIYAGIRRSRGRNAKRSISASIVAGLAWTGVLSSVSSRSQATQFPPSPLLAIQSAAPATTTGQPKSGQPKSGQPGTGQPRVGQPGTRPSAPKPGGAAVPAQAAAGAQPANAPGAPAKGTPGKAGRPRLLGDLLPPGAATNPESERRRPVRQPLDPQRAAAVGFRKLESKYLTMYTDLPSFPAVDELPAVFDLAIAPWCEYFGVERRKVEGWRLTGYLMRDRDRFVSAGAIPDYLPKFENGFQSGDEIWWRDDPADYYRRHLMLHEGTHAFMSRWLGGVGPPWFAEGCAELVATHRWSDGQLTMRYLPQDRDETPNWGRVKIVRDDFAAGRGMALPAIFSYDLQSHLRVEMYGWSWAAAQFLDAHPLSRAAFRGRFADAREEGPELTRRMLADIGESAGDLSEEWQLYAAEADYGYDIARAAVKRRPGQPLTDPEVRVKILASQGWQSTGVELQAGETYEVAAVGRYRLVAGPPEWPCEPGGVTIRYHRGLPLGMLVGAIRPDPLPANTLTPLARPQPIGRKRLVEPEWSGVLYLKINEPPGELADNDGELLVRIRKAPR